MCGCFAEVTAGGNRAGGGVTGYGWQLGVSLGASYDIEHTLRLNVGNDARLGKTLGSDGDLGTRSLGVMVRTDMKVADDVRATLAYSHSYLDSLTFTRPNDPKEYSGRATFHGLYLGIGFEKAISENNGISFGLGPHVTFMPNDFVGNATMIGGELRMSYFFIWERISGPGFGGFPGVDTYTPSKPDKASPNNRPSDRPCPSYTDFSRPDCAGR